MKRKLIFLAIVHLPVLCPAQDLPDDAPVEMSRDRWRDTLKASRERANLMRRERRGLPTYQPRLRMSAEEASKRILEDESLIPGDVVSTNRGLLRFQGSPEREHRPEDFVPVR
ncbi:hypothetical protein WI604_25785 [Bradyrhizobium symbiodeficiens]|uniref:hypothetical protein n=1 Tax=Bradyrhizobium symbiodeficiens TaxID=1404367 RepID=UPI0030CDAC62